MAIQKITYTNKEAINIDSTIPDKNKCNASDLNEIKTVVNNNADEIPSGDNLVNIGTSIDTNYKTNILYSSNIFNNVFQQGGLDLGSTGGEQTSDIRIRSDFIFVEPNTTYTISIGTNNLTHCGIGLYKSNRTYDSTHKINNGGWNTFPITFTTESDTQYIRVAFRYGDGNVITPNGDYKVQINKGYNTTYEEYVNQSININNEEFYSKPVVLYDNPNGTNGNITLSDNSDNYSYLEIFYGSGDGDIISTRTLPSKNFLLSTIDARTSVSQLYIRSALKNISGTSLTNTVFSNVVNYGTMKVTTSTNEFRNENTIKIYRVLGYK